MASSKYYTDEKTGVIQKDYVNKRRADNRKALRKKRAAEAAYIAKRKKSNTQKIKSIKEAQDRGSSTPSLIKKAKAKDRENMLKDRAKKSELIKAAKAEERTRRKEHLAEKKRNRKLVKDEGVWPWSSDKGYGKDAPRARSFMTPSRKGVSKPTIKKSDTKPSAQDLYDKRQRNKASGGSVRQGRGMGKALRGGGAVTRS